MGDPEVFVTGLLLMMPPPVRRAWGFGGAEGRFCCWRRFEDVGALLLFVVVEGWKWAEEVARGEREGMELDMEGCRVDGGAFCCLWSSGRC